MMEMPKGKWNEPEETELIELWEDHSYQQIAERLGRSPDAINNRIKRLRKRGLLPALPKIRGSDSRAWNEDDIRVLIELWNDHSGSEIGALLGISRNAVIGKLNRLREHGLLPRQAKPAAARKKPDNGSENKSLAVIPPPPPKSAPARPPPPLNANRCTFAELDLDRQCKFALGDAMERVTTDTLFCGAEAVDGLPYCPDHCRISYHATRESAHDRR